MSDPFFPRDDAEFYKAKLDETTKMYNQQIEYYNRDQAFIEHQNLEIKKLENELVSLNAILQYNPVMEKVELFNQFKACQTYRDKMENAESRLATAQELVEKWRSTEKTHNGVKCHAWKVCADEIDEILKGEG